MPAHSTMGSLTIEESEFHAIRSVGGLQSKSASQITLIGTAGSSSDDESSRLSSQMSSDSLSRHDEIVSCPREQRVRQLREIRAIRLKNRSTEEVIELDCSLDDLPSILRSSFDNLIKREKIHAVTVYNIVLNSLSAYFEKNGGEGSVESRICSFLSSRFIVSAAKARSAMEDELRGMDCVMVEMTSQLLLRLYCMQHAPESVHKLEIVKKLRYIYIHNCASALRSVLEEDISDVFGSSLPLLIGDLFMEVGVDDHLPVDIEDNIENITREKESSLCVSSTVSPATASPPQVHSPKVEVNETTEKIEREEKTTPVMAIKSSLSSRLEAMLDEFLIDDEEPSSEGRERERGNTQGGASQAVKSQTKTGKRKAPPATPTRDERRPRARRVFVPETPDEKRRTEEEKEKEEGRKTRSQMKEEIKAVVKQTPMEKVMSRGRKSTRGERLAELVKNAADSPSLTGGVASALRSRGKESEKRTTRSGRELFTKDCLASTSREEFLSANRDKGEKRSRIRVNLTEKLNTSVRGEEKEKRNKRRKTDGHISSLTLDSDAISKYRKRMKETVAEGSKADETEVFYGRMSNRVGLFDDRHEKEEAKVVYNRAGRVVYSPSCVFVAHTLLNVHNKSPLLPYKPSTSSAEFKLGRLVRPASKGSRLKLKKLKERLMTSAPKKEIKKEHQ
ncbi:hypothetical protein PFISCL1PPCAC_19442 [Pristionchus fissidentatus]|uniref:Treslin N-terminal domain-containing protein n=1 Tax=Pristionchus fissidentatus TaxID=1538716 RepID=A0AAV5W8V6_9BILA|nr:hypothetical protein PFISCL1PPCAC_19442 [Pristionchus fissidentatus]